MQLSLFDEWNLTEISSPDYPSERRIACFDPLLCEECRREREDLLQATKMEPDRIAKEVARRGCTPLLEAELGEKQPAPAPALCALPRPIADARRTLDLLPAR